MTRKQDLADRVDELEELVDQLIDITGASLEKTDRSSIDIPDDEI